jgi:SNF family Na+-dependent transporter
VPEAGPKNLPAVGVRPVLVAAFGTYRRRFWLIAGAALVVFGISAGIDVLFDVAGDLVGDYPGLLAPLLVIAGVATFGTTFFAGLLDRIVGEEERGHPRRSLREVVRTLPYWRLIGADVLLSLGAVVALLLLVVPGLIFYTFFSLVGPAVVMEDRGIFDGFRRSVRLVRGHFWLTLLLVTLPILVEEDVVHGIVALVGDASPLLVFVVNALAGAAVGSVVALVEVTLAGRLAMRKPDPRSLT